MEDFERIMELERPHRNLLIYYGLCSLMAGPFFLFPLIPLYFRYHTMRYRFDDEGVTMSWGILFRREVALAYSRVQDIHLASNLIERQLGLARIQIQTASGSSGAEMTVEGIQQFEELRNYLYSRMRGTTSSDLRKGLPSLGPSSARPPRGSESARPAAAVPVSSQNALAQSLDETAQELEQLAEILAQKRGASL